MSDASSIEWTDATWNPTKGCSRISDGCRNCYAERFAARFSKPGLRYHGFAERTDSGPRWTGRVAIAEEQLRLPLEWREPRRIFVDSMSDLFHEALPFPDVARLFEVMRAASQHTYQVLTKRPTRMLEWLWSDDAAPYRHLPQIWLGVSVEDQETARSRIPILLDAPAAVRFVSAEPLLAPIVLRRWLGDEGGMVPARGVDWVIVGGESGPAARPFDPAWARTLLHECRVQGAAFFMKQLGGRVSKHSGEEDIPDDLRVREFPERRRAPCRSET